MAQVKGTTATYVILLGAAFLWCVMIFLAPIAALAGWNDVSGNLYSFFSTVCHQLDSHSLHIGMEKLGVCARCTAIYLGFLLGVAVYPALKPIDGAELPAPKWLLAASVPMLVDVVLAVSRLHAATVATRLATGGVFGFIIAFTIVPGLLHSVPTIFVSIWRNHASKT